MGPTVSRQAHQLPVVASIGILASRKPLVVLLGRESVKVGVGKEGLTLAAYTAVSVQAESKFIATGLADPETEKRLQAVRNIGVVPIAQEQARFIRVDLQRLLSAKRIKSTFL